MSALDPAPPTAALAALRAAFVAAQHAPAVESSALLEDDEQTDIATPRAKAALALEAALKARRVWYRDRGQHAGERLCATLIDMCAWHEHPRLRAAVLALQDRGLALLEAAPAGEPRTADAGALEDEYQQIKPRADDGAAIAAALGMTLEEARAFGLVGTLAVVDMDEEDAAPARAADAMALPDDEEDLETLFRREALAQVTRTLPQALQRFWGAQQSVDALLDVRRGFHTLKGDARVTAQSAGPDVAQELEGVAVLAEAAEDIVDYLLGDDYDTSRPAPALPPGAFSLLNEAASFLARRLEARAPIAQEDRLLQRLEAMHHKAAALSGTPLPDTGRTTGAAPRPRPATPAASRAAKPAPSTPSLLPTFLAEAGRLMPDLHRALGALSENPADEDALVRARIKLHTLKGGAALVGDEAREIQQIAHSAEDLFELIEDFQLRGEMSAVPRAVLEGVLDAEDALQALLDLLRPQGQSSRLTASTLLMPLAPAQLTARLNEIADQVRSGGFAVTPLSGTGEPPPAEPAEPPADAPPPEDAGSLSPLPHASAPLLQRPDLTSFDAEAGPVAPAVAPALLPRLRTIAFGDFLERASHAEVRAAAAVFSECRLVENRAARAGAPFTLYTCVQYLSSYEQERARYVALAAHGHIYVFGKPDVVPAPADGITVVPLLAGDALALERTVILDTPDAPAAYFARVDPSERVFAGQRYLSAFAEDAPVVREAADRMRVLLDHEHATIASRMAQLAPTVPAAPQPHAPEDAATRRRAPAPSRIARPAQEYGKEHGVGVALEMLEDLSVKRDALQELIGNMARQGAESRRSTRRLRTLVERVGSELAELRSELVRTSGHSGEWDLLEKEEYTAVDVLLMQLDEALADLEASGNTLRRDIGEAQAQIEMQSDSQLRAQRALLNVSMIPLAHLEDRLAHAVRSQSRRLGKPVSFRLEGADLLLDGRIAESLFDPLMHLINNAIDHGIEEQVAERAAAGKPEEGCIVVRGRARGDGVAIEVTDDGRGIDPERVAAVAVSRGLVSAQEAAAMGAQERLALIWRPGFSTARQVSAISGRGIGMKSVLDDIGNLQGRVELHSEVGVGTTCSLLLPRSLAMLRVELVREGRDLVALPITQIVATHPVAYGACTRGAGGASVRIGDRTLRIYDMHLANGPAGDGEAGHGMLLEVAGRQGGILVDEVLGSQYLPVRAAPAYLRGRCALLGYAVGGGGRILSIIDLPALVDRSAHAASSPDAEQPARPVPTVLVVDDSQTMRRALRNTLARAGFQVREAADGREALALCTRVMPDLITLDMEMPGMDGLEALSALRLLPNGGAQVPVFMVTSRQQARHRAAALAAGVTRYFTKPYDGDELIGAAQLVLAEGTLQPREAAS